MKVVTLKVYGSEKYMTLKSKRSWRRMCPTFFPSEDHVFLLPCTFKKACIIFSQHDRTLKRCWRLCQIEIGWNHEWCSLRIDLGRPKETKYQNGIYLRNANKWQKEKKLIKWSATSVSSRISNTKGRCWVYQNELQGKDLTKFDPKMDQNYICTP